MGFIANCSLIFIPLITRLPGIEPWATYRKAVSLTTRPPGRLRNTVLKLISMPQSRQKIKQGLNQKYNLNNKKQHTNNLR